MTVAYDANLQRRREQVVRDLEDVKNRVREAGLLLAGIEQRAQALIDLAEGGVPGEEPESEEQSEAKPGTGKQSRVA